MMTAASFGPIIVINVSPYRCDAFLIEGHGIRTINLPNLHLRDIEENVKRLKSARSSPKVSRVLEWLWDVAAGPILDKLGFQETPSGDKWPHVWWIPTSMMSYLPLHAAGYHYANSSRTVLDRVVSSYSPSIKALLYARRYTARTNPSTTFDQALLISMPETRQLPPLPFAKAEVKMLSQLLSSLPGLKLKELTNPSKEEVLGDLNVSKIFHFAGHGRSDHVDPSKSCLLLDDWQENLLTVEDLMGLKLSLNSPYLCYLSGCETGLTQVDKLLDEGIHLMSACQLAGFRHVIGSLWGIGDAASVDIAEGVYQTMISSGGMSNEAISQGLHKATRSLRDSFSRIGGVRRAMFEESEMEETGIGDPMIWAPYIHVGI